MSVFVDRAQLNARGGDGGAGAVSMRREAHVPRGGPDGGDGGDGGSVWLVADHNVSSLLSFRDHPHRRGDSGTHGQGKKRHGKAGTDLVVHVPPGTVVRDPDGEVLVDLVSSGDRWQAARGGQGGRGNARFLSNRRRAPTFAEQGEEGEERWLDLELKLMADVALVGFPNVGKSTLISRISAAKPRIADYPFTTLEPNLGVVRLDDGDMIVADVPGLIEGASEGRGLGHQFLRHVERARVLCVLIDLSPLAPHPPAEQERILLAELGAYQPDLLERPRLVIGSRSDLAEPGVVDGVVSGRGSRDAEVAPVGSAGAPDGVASDGAAPGGVGSSGSVGAGSGGAASDGVGSGGSADATPEDVTSDGAATGGVISEGAGSGAASEGPASGSGGSADAASGGVASEDATSDGLGGAASGGSAVAASGGAASGGSAGAGSEDATSDVMATQGAISEEAPGGIELVISAVTGENLPVLVGRLSILVRAARASEAVAGDGFVVHRPAATGVSVVRDDDGRLRVVGRAAERSVALSDITSADALAYVRERLDRLGVPKALARAGAREGDEVRIGAFSFDYVPDDAVDVSSGDPG